MKKENKYLTIKELSADWGVPERTIRNYCANGKIEGAILRGKIWFIPDDVKKIEKVNVKKNYLFERLKEEKSHSIKGMIYHKLQIEMTYNSNHIEGSKLTHDETRYIFETRTIGKTNKNIRVDDLIETVNHFSCIDKVIDMAKRKLTERFIKELHFILKSNTSDANLSWFNVGEYKKLPNEVGGNITCKPEDVKKEMKKLIDSYTKKNNHSFEEILDFHYLFEKIHPFQDGNGRIGRLIAFKECLKNNIVPFIIDDELKNFYYRGLQKWKSNKGYLLDTCLAGQDKIKAYLDYFKIKYNN